MILRILILEALLVAGCALAEDWPTYRHDNRRSGVTQEKAILPLYQSWVRRSSVAPMMAWSGPAKWDAFSGNKDLQSMRNFDPAFFVTAAQGAVYFSSSVDDAVHCLNAGSGEERWVSFAGGAVRLPPTIEQGRAYFGSDDGYAYCIDVKEGGEIWKFRAARSNRLIASNGKVISPWPVRSGVLVSGQHAYFAASLLPWENSYVCALDKVSGKAKYVSENANMTLQGALLGSSTTIYAPQGRSVPLLFEASTGKALRGIPGMGGTFCLLTEDEHLVGIPQNQKSSGNVIQIADPSGSEAMLQFHGAERLLVVGEMAFIHQGNILKSFNRAEYGRLHVKIAALNSQVKTAKNKVNQFRKSFNALSAQKKQAAENTAKTKIQQFEDSIRNSQQEISTARKAVPECFGWGIKSPVPYELIYAGGVLFIGGNGTVIAFDAGTGEELWSGSVEGQAYGLVFSEGRLFVSTSLGHIYCFSGK
ncbi:MAG: PQQ-binding-like beta-propeller repeat protein [Verrucomicrobiales bacterium]